MSKSSQRPTTTAFGSGFLVLTLLLSTIFLIMGFYFEYWRLPGLILLGGTMIGLILLVGLSPFRSNTS